MTEEELPAQSPEQYLAFQEAMDRAEKRPGWLVVLGIQRQQPDEKRLHAFAKAARLDGFTAKQWLASPAPRLWRREKDQERAVEWVKWLRELQIRSFLLNEEELLSLHFHDQKAAWSGDGVVITESLDGYRDQFPTEAVACLVFGQVRERVTEERRRKGMFNDKELPTEAKEEEQELVLDIHFRDGRQPLRFRQNSVQFSQMFPEETGASIVLMQRLLKKLRAMAPHVVVYDAFGKVEGALGTSVRLLSQDVAVALNWRRMGRTLDLEERRTLKITNAPAFDLYSVLAQCDCLED